MEAEKGTGQSYNLRDQELIHELIKSRMAQDSKMEFEDLSDYELPPPAQFSMLKKPAVSIKYKELNFNTACIRLFEGVKYILPIVNPKKKRLAVVPCKEEESASVQWARKKDDVWMTRQITSLEFVEKIFAMMGWDRNCRYKTVGRVADSTSGLILVFDLEEAVFFDAKPQEYVDEEGKVKKRRTVYYPNEYKDHIGKSYNDYAAARQLNIFEYLEGYVGQTYGDAKKADDGSNNSNSAESVDGAFSAAHDTTAPLENITSAQNVAEEKTHGGNFDGLGAEPAGTGKILLQPGQFGRDAQYGSEGPERAPEREKALTGGDV